VTNIFGYDDEIIYKEGKKNVVVDALSWKHEEDGFLFSLSFIVAEWSQVVHQEWLQDPKFSCLIQQLQQCLHASPGYSWHNEELHYKCRMYLSKQSHLNSFVLYELHASPTIGHSGFCKTYERVKLFLFLFLGRHEIGHPHLYGQM
jgi:hypothetical protein